MNIDRYSRRFYRRPTWRSLAALALIGVAAAAVAIGTIAAIVEVTR